jgi:hypothetical protein
VKPFGYFILALAGIVLIGWIVSKVTGSRAFFIEDWKFNDGETVLWRDDQSDTYLIPELGQSVVMSYARLHRGAVVVTNQRILVGSLPLFGKKHMVQYVLYPTKVNDQSDRLDGGLLTTGYQTIVFDPGTLDVQTKETKTYVDLTPSKREASSTNLQTIRIFTDLATTFRLP